jgi:hypothetical protein
LIEDRIGPVDPGQFVDNRSPMWGPDLFSQREQGSCWLGRDKLPTDWLIKFPAASEIVRKVVEMRPCARHTPDQRLLRRRECEYELFRSLEEAIELPAVSSGFNSIEAFVDRAQSILQRRKARSGRSLELHLREIFLEERLIEGRHFSHQPISENTKKPDYLFPSEAAYRDPSFPAERLRMLAVKTTCKDRWRQILNEADRVGTKHLLTLQEGVSPNQFAEMQSAKVRLVVPEKIKNAYPESMRSEIQSVEDFITDIRALAS